MSRQDVPKHAEGSGAKERRARRLGGSRSTRTETRDFPVRNTGHPPSSRPDQKSKPGGVKGVESSEPSVSFDVEAAPEVPDPDPVLTMERRMLVALTLVLGIWVVSYAI